MKLTRRKRALLSLCLLAGAIGACDSDAENPNYCDAEKPCSSAGDVCDIVTNSCVTPTVEADAGADIDAAPACGDGNQCVAVPIEWTGPLVRFTADTAEDLPDCDGDYPEELATLGGEIETTEDCSCSCGDVQGATCGNGSVLGASGVTCTAQACLGNAPSCFLELSAAVSTSVPSIHRGSSFRGVMGNLNGGSCSPPTASGSVTSSFASQTRLCQATANDGNCELGEACRPTFPEDLGSQCISHEGDIECPAETPFAERIVLFESLDDQRACSAESCACATPNKCTGTVSLSRKLFPTTTLLSFSPPSCIVVPALDPPKEFTGVYNYKYFPDASPACTLAGAGEVQGELSGNTPTTVCCIPAE